MISPARPALLVAQSGGCTAAINASLAGVVEAALDSAHVGPIYGARFGVDGILAEQFIDLRAQERGIWRGIKHTPSAALGSCRRRLDAAAREAVLQILMDRGIRFLIYIGGNDSADTALRLHESAVGRGYDLRVVSVPKTIDNDLPGTDHCPGYGSAARFIAQTTQDAGLDTGAMRASDPIKIIEVMGRDAGWLAAASTLGRRDERDAPHLVCVPERPLDVDAFIGAVDAVYRRYGYVVAVVAETIRDVQGKPLGAPDAVRRADAFGHPTIVGAAQALTTMIGDTLGLKTRFDKPGTIQRMCMALSSPVDLDEAYRAGAQAVRFALDGRSGCMVGLVRDAGPVYRCTLEPVDLHLVANAIRPMPEQFLGPAPFAIGDAFADYALPLLGPPLLTYARLHA